MSKPERAELTEEQKKEIEQSLNDLADSLNLQAAKLVASFSAKVLLIAKKSGKNLNEATMMVDTVTLSYIHSIIDYSMKACSLLIDSAKLDKSIEEWIADKSKGLDGVFEGAPEIHTKGGVPVIIHEKTSQAKEICPVCSGRVNLETATADEVRTALFEAGAKGEKIIRMEMDRVFGGTDEKGGAGMA